MFVCVCFSVEKTKNLVLIFIYDYTREYYEKCVLRVCKSTTGFFEQMPTEMK